ncbi:hypothetical protein [Burkholderia ambifaria]|uniref:hypothetical protein n=1 Tax=Burkholderia ambifaria TaxID=152480 RepID=UPI000B2D6204|nr:hypothetical protein [Burkholderia ambifaria]
MSRGAAGRPLVPGNLPLQPPPTAHGASNGRADVCLPFDRWVLDGAAPVFEIDSGKNYRFPEVYRFRLLFLCNRQDADMKEWWDGRGQKAAVKKSKKYVKTNTYNSSPLSLFLVLEKLISFICRSRP